MNLLWAGWGAAAGLAAGAVLRGTVVMLSVPHGEPDLTTCSRCAAPVRRWLVVRCEQCGSSIGRPGVLEACTAAVLALLLGRFAHRPEVVAFACLGALGVALASIDIAVHRLPDLLTLPAIAMVIALLAIAAAIERQGGAMSRALLGGLAMATGYFLLALLRPGELGGGDIKLAALVGLVLGWLGWPAVVGGAALGFLLAGVAGLALLALRRVTLRSQISFGPFLLGGALIAMLTTGRAPG